MIIYKNSVSVDPAAVMAEPNPDNRAKPKPKHTKINPPIPPADATPKELNISFYCIINHKNKAFLNCPVCEFYRGACKQITPEHCAVLEASNFFTVARVAWSRPKRRDKMYIARMSDGSLKELPGFDPKIDAEDPEMFRGVEEVLCVTKVLQRKITWSAVSTEQRKTMLSEDPVPAKTVGVRADEPARTPTAVEDPAPAKRKPRRRKDQAA